MAVSAVTPIPKWWGVAACDETSGVAVPRPWGLCVVVKSWWQTSSCQAYFVEVWRHLTNIRDSGALIVRHRCLYPVIMANDITLILLGCDGCWQWWVPSWTWYNVRTNRKITLDNTSKKLVCSKSVMQNNALLWFTFKCSNKIPTLMELIDETMREVHEV